MAVLLNAPEGISARVEAAQARSAIFALLARVFGGLPTAGLIKAMKSRQMSDSLAAWGIAFDNDFLTGDEKRLARDLAQEYTRLFVGPGTHISANESIFVPDNVEAVPRYWGKATAEVAAFFAEIGFELPQGTMPDHISLELKAMSVMSQAQAERLVAGDEAGACRFAELQGRFCYRHLQRWVPAACREIQRKSEHSFYRNMANLTAGLVAMTCGEINGNIKEKEA